MGRKKRGQLKNAFGPFRLTYILVAAVVVLMVALAYPLMKPASKKKAAWAENPSFDIRIQVLNGCGTEGVAEEVASCLRDAGFDIVGTGNADAFDYAHTLVIDRCGQAEKAANVGKSLQCDRILVQRIASPASDVVVLVGADWTSLALVREGREGKGTAYRR